MLKQILAAVAALFLAASAYAAVDVNRASQSELEAVKGVGPALSTLIVSERKKREFSDWSDLIARVKGVGERSATKFSANGLTVQGSPYAGVSPTAAAKTMAPAGARIGKKADAAEQSKKTPSAVAAPSSAKR
jgi:competence protein ComEA